MLQAAAESEGGSGGSGGGARAAAGGTEDAKPGTILWESGAVGGSISLAYHAHIRPLMQRILSICLACLSVAVLASEVEVLLVASDITFQEIR